MSRIGKVPLRVAEKVTVSLQDGKVLVKGPLGGLDFRIPPLVGVTVEDGVVKVTRTGEAKEARAQHGMTRKLIQNMVHGVSAGFERRLEINGVGYRADMSGGRLLLSLGFSHPVEFPIPQGVKVKIDKQTLITLQGVDNHLVSEVAAKIRSLKPPEPYKGKGIKYADEVIHRKVGKAAA